MLAASRKMEKLRREMYSTNLLKAPPWRSRRAARSFSEVWNSLQAAGDSVTSRSLPPAAVTNPSPCENAHHVATNRPEKNTYTSSTSRQSWQPWHSLD